MFDRENDKSSICLFRCKRAPYSSLGQNPKSLSGEKAGAEGWVDAGSEAFSSERSACFIGFEHIVSGVAEDGEVQRGGVFSGSAAVFVESHVHRPMQIVLDAPMGAHGGEDGVWGR